MNMTELVQAIRGGLIQQDRLLKSEIPVLPQDTLIPRRAVTFAELGRDFSVEVDMVSTFGDIELKKLIAQPMTLWLQQADKSYLPVNGYIHTARRLGADGSLTAYQLTFASWMYFLRFRSDMRQWQDLSIDQIVADVFNQHPQAQGRFEFALSAPLPSVSYCRQSETDWNFVHRLLESEGLFGFWRQAKDGQSHTFVITDDLCKLDSMSPETVEFYRSGSGSEANALTQWATSRTLQSVTYTTRTFDYKTPSVPFNPKGTTLPTRENQGELPDQLEIYTYTGAYNWLDQRRGDHLTRIQLEEWESRAKRFHGAGGVYGIDAGCRFTLAYHPAHDRDSLSQREFAAIKVSRYIENNLPLSDREGNFPHSLRERIALARATYSGDGTCKVRHADGSEGCFLVEVEAQRTSVPYRSPFEHRKPEMHLETAIVAGPAGEEIYTDDLNRVKVQFVWDRTSSGNEKASCWIRVAQSDSGNGYGGVHLPRVGEEVIVGHVGGDCDRPIVLHRVFNGAVKPQWHSNGIMSGYRTKEYAGAGFNELALDDATGQNRVRLMSSTGNSLLHLGYLIDQSGNARGAYLGSGFDLKTDSYGAVRANQGLYVSTHEKDVSGQMLDVAEANGQLANAGSLMEALSDASVGARAESSKEGYGSLKAFNKATQQDVAGSSAGGRTAGGGLGKANGFARPVMLMASPAGIALSTQDSTQVAADQHVNIVSGESTHIVTGKSMLATVGEKFSLFVQNAGMKLYAGHGKVEVQAQGNAMALGALNDVTITSSKGRVVLSAEKEIWVGAGGSYIKISANGIENGTTGAIFERCASWNQAGATSAVESLPVMPITKQEAGDQHFVLRSHDGKPVPNQKYRMSIGDSVIEGETDASGKTQTVEGYVGQPVHFEILDDVYDEHFIVRDALGDPIANMPYQILAEDGRVVEGMTDAEGRTSLFTSDKIVKVDLLYKPSGDDAFPADAGVN
jgi:type VI secretion system secreted protein VgrG